MNLKDLATNVTLGCCIGVSSSFGSGYDISAEKLNYINSYNYNAVYTTNISYDEAKISDILDIHIMEATKLISIINKKLELNIVDYFIPNKESEDNITLFITCNKFISYCENNNFEDALKLEHSINDILLDELLTNTKINKIAFL
jgi:hypothetical protein